MSSPKQRATTIAQYRAASKLMMSKAEYAEGLSLQLNLNDVVICPFAKSGTTWLQQIVHCLRTGGDMDFDDISRVVPWIETSPALGIDLSAAQRAEPRAFKSHLDASTVPAGGRYINAMRDPKDVAYSLYKFTEGWFIEPGAIEVDEFVREMFIVPGNYWRHLLSWWQRRQDEDVLFLAYENIKTDLPSTVRQVAQFIGIEADTELLALTEQHASFEFMKQYNNRFDDLLMRELSERRCHLPAGSSTSKVRAGTVGAHCGRLSKAVLQELDDIWLREITPTTGFKNYPALLAALNKGK